MDLLRNTAGFLQVDSQAEFRLRRTRAAAALRTAAKSPDFDADELLAAWRGRKGGHAGPIGVTGGPRNRLSTLAVTVSLDSFTKIKEAMDKMTADLKLEQEEEVKFKAHCDKEFDVTEKSTYTKTEEKEDLEALIESLAKKMKTLGEEIDA